MVERIILYVFLAVAFCVCMIILPLSYRCFSTLRFFGRNLVEDGVDEERSDVSEEIVDELEELGEVEIKKIEPVQFCFKDEFAKIVMLNDPHFIESSLSVNGGSKIKGEAKKEEILVVEREPSTIPEDDNT